MATQSQALTVQFDAFDSGSYTSAGRHAASITDIRTGWAPYQAWGGTSIYRSFEAFDLSSIANATVNSAALRFNMGQDYRSVRASETLSIGRHLLDVDSLLSDRSFTGFNSTHYYQMVGEFYTNTTILKPSSGKLGEINVDLGIQAASDLTTFLTDPSEYRFVVSQQSNSVWSGRSLGQDWSVLGGSTAGGLPFATLILDIEPAMTPVPIPATGLLLIGALGGFGIFRRRSKT